MTAFFRCVLLALLALGAIGAEAQTTPQQADALFKDRQFSAARQAYLAAAQASQDPSAALALKVRAAQCLLELGDFAGMKSECDTLLAQPGDNPNKAALQQARHLLASVAYRQKRWVEAEAALGQFIQANPDDSQLDYCISNRAEALESLKRYVDARQVLLDYAAKHPGTPKAAEFKFRAARCLLWKRDYTGFKEEMAALLPELAANKPLEQKAKGLLAQVPFHQGKWTEAEAALGQFVEANPDAAANYLYDAVRMRGAALCRLKRFDDAHKQLLDFAQQHPALPEAKDARWRATLCLYDKGDYATFTSEAQPLATLDAEKPNYSAAMVRMRLAQVPSKSGQWLEMAQGMEKLIPDQALGDNLDWVQIHCGEGYVKAAMELEKKGGQTQAEALRAKGHQVLLDARTRLEAQRAAAKDNQSLGDRARTRILDTYYMEEDYAGIARVAPVFTEESRAPSLAWAKAMTWLGVAKCKQNPPDWAGAATALDAVLSADVVDDSIEENIPSTAAYWRALIARAQNDQAACKSAVERLKTMPDGPIKAAALRRFGN